MAAGYVEPMAGLKHQALIAIWRWPDATARGKYAA
jgi:hypothetical protein